MKLNEPHTHIIYIYVHTHTKTCLYTSMEFIGTPNDGTPIPISFPYGIGVSEMGVPINSTNSDTIPKANLLNI